MNAIARSSIYMSAEMQALIEEVKRLSGTRTRSEALLVTLREYVEKRRRQIPGGFQRITVTAYFDQNKTVEKRVFTGRWVISPAKPVEVPPFSERYAAAISERGNWIVLRWISPIPDESISPRLKDCPEVRVYESLEKMRADEYIDQQVVEHLVALQEEKEWAI